MAWPVTLYDYTFTEADFEGTNYVTGIPLLAEKIANHVAALLNATSTSSITIGTGSKSLTIQANKPWLPGAGIRISRASNPDTHFMAGIVTSYDIATGALVLNVTAAVGSGTFTSWNINFDSPRAGVSIPAVISEGGTGANTAGGALTNLGGTATGVAIFTAASAAAARTSLGFSATGDALATAATAAAARATLGSATVGDLLFTSATTSAAQDNIGAGATGKLLFTSTSASGARSTLGATTIGGNIFTAADAAAVRTLIGASTFGGSLMAAADAAAGRALFSLGNMATASAASQAEAEAGLVSTSIMTPQRTAQAIAALADSSSGRLIGIVVFNSSGTYTKNNNANYIRARVWGGTGGSGGANANAGGDPCASGAGAGAGYSEEKISNSLIGATETVTVGAAGAAGAGTIGAPGAGGTGGTSSFGTTPFLSAAGGTGGAAGNGSGNKSGGTGGAGSGGDINLTGQNGGASWANNAAGFGALGGRGGASPFGVSFGADGVSIPNSGSSAGQAGQAGLVIIEEYA